LENPSVHSSHDVETEPKQTRPPYAQVPHHVLNHPDLNPGDRAMYARLDTYWRENNDVCWAGQERLAREERVSVDTVQRRLAKLKKAKVIEVRRRGLTHTNLYVRLQPRQLHAVPDEAPDTEDVRPPETATVRPQEAAPVRHKADAVEADAREESKSTGASLALDARECERSPNDSRSVVRAMQELLLPVVSGADTQTAITYARIIEQANGRIHEGHIEYLRDKLTGELPDHRYSTIEADDEARYICRALETYADGCYAGPLPNRYERLRGAESNA
jgi:hypothetical protein